MHPVAPRTKKDQAVTATGTFCVLNNLFTHQVSEAENMWPSLLVAETC